MHFAHLTSALRSPEETAALNDSCSASASIADVTFRAHFCACIFVGGYVVAIGQIEVVLSPSVDMMQC